MGAGQNRVYFPLLDGIRGLTAIAVMFRHLQLFGIHSRGQSYLGVDIFFALSGVVIASAYERKLRDGLSTQDFFWIRWRRLWPMIAIGVGLGVINTLWGEPEGPVRGRLWLYARLALVLCGDSPFMPALAFDRPSWTMTFEFLVNVVYAKSVGWLTSPILVLICSVSALGLVWAALATGGLDTGGSPETLLFGAARTVFAFFLGVGLYRVRQSGRWALWPILRGPLGAVACFGVLGLCLYLPPFGMRWLVALLSAFVLVPAIVWLGMASEVGGWLKAVFLVLGAASYPLYLIHDPLGMLVAGNLIHHGLSAYLPAALKAFVPSAIALALVIHYWVDEPFRAWLANLLRRLQPMVAPAQAG